MPLKFTTLLTKALWKKTKERCIHLYENVIPFFLNSFLSTKISISPKNNDPSPSEYINHIERIGERNAKLESRKKNEALKINNIVYILLICWLIKLFLWKLFSNSYSSSIGSSVYIPTCWERQRERPWALIFL